MLFFNTLKIHTLLLCIKMGCRKRTVAYFWCAEAELQIKKASPNQGWLGTNIGFADF